MPSTAIYPLSLHDALPICGRSDRDPLVSLSGLGGSRGGPRRAPLGGRRSPALGSRFADRKSTRLNSSHLGISYAVFCLKKTIERRPRQQPHRLRKFLDSRA